MTYREMKGYKKQKRMQGKTYIALIAVPDGEKRENRTGTRHRINKFCKTIAGLTESEQHHLIVKLLKNKNKKKTLKATR